MADNTTKIVTLDNLDTYTDEIKKIIPSLVHISQDDYNKLSEAEKMNGTYYFVED